MKDGFLKVAAASPRINVADCAYNTKQIIKVMQQAYDHQIKLLVLPELCITGYTCGDLFLQNKLLEGATQSLLEIKQASKPLDMVVVVGAPILRKGKLYNCAVVIQKGQILGVVPKTNLPNYAEFYEKRHFTKAPLENTEILIGEESYPFGTKLLFACKEMPSFCLAVEICEDLWVPAPPSTQHALAGATVIANLSAGDEIIAKADYRRELVIGQSGRLICAYLYASAGEGESTTDMVFSGHNIIAENGACLKENKLFDGQSVMTEVDVEKLLSERQKNTSFPLEDKGYQTILFSIKQEETPLTRWIAMHPFIPSNKSQRQKRCEEILTMQAMGLKKRLAHTHAKSAVIGISGGLDSTLALLVVVRAMDLLEKDRKDIVAVTMPCFGTSQRTKQNAMLLCEKLGVTLREIDITKAVEVHFEDIGHNKEEHDVVFENAQARERTKVLMNVANQVNGLVIGTGDLSELALGWATYNGDHMSMYGVNASIPKTLVAHIVDYVADTVQDETLQRVLKDIVDTPVSPELLPPKEDVISQKTEDIVGPYELHDFFLYYMMRFGFSPKKIYRMAVYAFGERYEAQTILKWLHIFYKRFFAQQFKRSCLPDGAKVGSVTLSPRGDWRMPSDASSSLWLKEIEALKP